MCSHFLWNELNIRSFFLECKHLTFSPFSYFVSSWAMCMYVLVRTNGVCYIPPRTWSLCIFEHFSYLTLRCTAYVIANYSIRSCVPIWLWVLRGYSKSGESKCLASVPPILENCRWQWSNGALNVVKPKNKSWKTYRMTYDDIFRLHWANRQSCRVSNRFSYTKMLL